MKIFSLNVLILVGVFFWFSNTYAGDLSLTGNWNYQDTNDTGDELSENYSVNVGHSLNLTEAMSIGGTLRFNRNKTETLTRENLSPSISYLINNDLFNFNLSGTANEEFNSKNAENSSRSLAASWSSAWEKDKWIPYIGLNFSKNWVEDDQTPHLRDTDAMNTGLNLDWEYLASKLFYSFNFNDNKNNVAGSESKTNNHLARYDYTRSFFKDRASISFSQQYNTTTNENTLPVSGGTALLPVAVSAFSGEVNPPGGNYNLSTNAALTNGDTTDIAATSTVANDTHIGFRTNSQTVTTLYLYTDATLLPAVYGLYTWALYSSPTNNVNTWSFEKNIIGTNYDTVNNRFEIDISGVTSEYLGVVAVTDDGTASVNFSEIEVYQEISATGNTTLVKNRFTNHKTDVNLTFDVTSALQLTSNFSYEQNDNSSGPDLNSVTVNNSLSWYPRDDVTIRLNGDFSSRKRDNALEDQNRSYGLTVSFPPLSTVDTTWGASLSESYQGTQHLTSSYNYNFQAVADLYKDLGARFNGSYVESVDEVLDNKNNATNLQMVLTARLVPGLVADLSSNYAKSSGQSATVNSTVNLHWRLSEMLAVTGNFSQAWASTDTSSMSIGGDLALTRNMQLSLTHSRTIRPFVSHTTTMSWKWTISQYISMLTSGSYQDGQGSESWSITSRLNARFSVM